MKIPTVDAWLVKRFADKPIRRDAYTPEERAAYNANYKRKKASGLRSRKHGEALVAEGK